MVSLSEYSIFDFAEVRLDLFPTIPTEYYDANFWRIEIQMGYAEFMVSCFDKTAD